MRGCACEARAIGDFDEGAEKPEVHQITFKFIIIIETINELDTWIKIGNSPGDGKI